MKQNTLRRAAALALAAGLTLACGLPAAAAAPNPDPGKAVIDTADILSRNTENYITDLSVALQESCGAQIGVYTVDTIGNYTMEGYTYELANAWGLGDADKDNGIVLVLAPGEDDYRAMCGTGLETQFTVPMLQTILDENLLPSWEEGPVEAVHPAIKNVAGAQSSGAALVSFNAPAFCSYGKEQNLNAPTGKSAAFAYTAALNHLLSDRERVYRVGDATVVCWAKNAKPAYAALFGGACFGAPVSYTDADLRGMVRSLCSGQPVVYEEDRLDPDMDFYVLGLSPNAARLSVRFFLHNSFGNFLKNIQAHQNRLEIVRPAYDKFETLPLWKLLSETVNQNARDKSPAPDLAGEVLRAVLNNTRYPATLLNGVTLRIRAEHEVTRGRAAILKAYYLQNPHSDVPKEVLTVSLNQESANVPYTLGRIFSVLEAIQESANPGINATIKDKYFNSAASTPAVIFPILINLAQKHLKKLRGGNTGLAVFYEKQLTELCTHIGDHYPARMNLPQQGSFQLGYYCQTQARYQKKEENKNV